MNEPVGNWRQIAIAGHPCDLYEPGQMNRHGYVVIYLHGVHLGRIGDQPAFTEQFARHGLTVVAPWTQRSWWTDIVCPEFDPELTAERHLLDNVLPFIQEQFGTEPPQIGLFGTSMGGQGALRFSYKHSETFPVVAGISPAIDYYERYDEYETIQQMYPDAEAARQDSATLLIHPFKWPRHQFFCCDPADTDWWYSSDRLRMKLGSSGVPYECDMETTAGGHGFDYYNAMAQRTVDFLVNGLDRERLRIV